MKQCRIVLAVLVSMLALSGCAAVEWKLRQSVDPPTGTVKLAGLHEQTTISRDELGIPFVEARTEDDLFFATGYAMASDRLWQMVAMKMASQGRLSEILGREVLDVDIYFRTIGMKTYIDTAMAKLDPRSQACLESFSQGVNAYLARHTDLPLEFKLTRYRPKPWTPQDCLYAFGLVSWGLSYNIPEELAFLTLAHAVGYEKAAWLFPIYPDEQLPRDEALKLRDIPAEDLVARTESVALEIARGIIPRTYPASNNWALAGSRTLSGKSIVCNDTHLELSIPSAWQIIHLKCPTYEAAGVMVPGVPLVVLGYNGTLAWGVTMVMADSQDLFVEKLKQEGGKTLYFSQGAWIPVTERREVFKIKGKAPVEKIILSTPHGPILNTWLKRVPVYPETPLPDGSRYGVALTMALEGAGDSFAGIYNLAKARTIDEARKDIAQCTAMYLNFVFGDSDNIAWQVSGAYPLRKKGTGMLPSPGWDGAYGWTGFVPFDQIPHAENPPNGYLATANNRTVPKEYPVNLTSTWARPERSERLNQVLGSMKNVATGDMIELQFDQYSPLARKVQTLFFDSPFAGVLQNAVNGLPEKDKIAAREGLELLKPAQFDGVMRADAKGSANAAVYGAFLASLTRNIFLDELGPEDGLTWTAFTNLYELGYSAPEDHLLYRPDSPFWDDIRTAQKELRPFIVARSLADAMRLCQKTMGDDPREWQWGKLHTYHFQHDFAAAVPFTKKYLNRGPFPAGGDTHTLNIAGFPLGRSFDVDEIPAMRLIVDFGLPDPAFLTTFPGESGNPASPHYDDMTKGYFLTGKNHPLPFKEDNIHTQYKDTLILKP